MSILQVQTNFSHGELSPKMVGRPDLQLYLSGASKLNNMVVIPQGGARRRFGTQYINQITADSNEYQLYRFELSSDTHYLLVWTDLLLTIYKDDLPVFTEVTPYTGAMLAASQLKFAQTQNLLVITQEDTQPYALQNDGTDVLWTFTLSNIKFFPAYDFAKNYDAAKFTLDQQTIGTGRTLTSTLAVFNLGHVDGQFIGLGPLTSTREGIATITAFNSDTEVVVEIISEFDPSFAPATGVLGKNVFLGERAWGDPNNHGWPKSCTFYEGRLIFGGSKALPQTVFMSVVADFFNFNAGIGLDSDAILETMSTDQVNEILHVVSDRCLQIFTSSAEFADPQVDGSPLTAGTIAILKQTNNGSQNVEPIVLDNSTFYVKRGGKGVQSFAFTEVSQSYHSTNVSIISEQLINDPIDSAILRGSRDDDADYLLLVNSDGTLATYQTMVNQNVSAWTLSDTNFQTDGKFKRITNVDNVIYVIVERVIDGITVQYLERLSFNCLTDSTIKQNFLPPETVIDGLDHLEGELVQIIADGYVDTPKVVTDGIVSIDFAAEKVDVGLRFDPVLTTMPISVQTSDGPATYIPKRITRIFVDYFESLGILVDGTTKTIIPYLQFGSEVLDQVPQVKSGVYNIPHLGGWDPRQTITLTQTDPIPMTVLAIGYEVEI